VANLTDESPKSKLEKFLCELPVGRRQSILLQKLRNKYGALAENPYKVFGEKLDTCF
jgi:hypothetical protein